jgi:hypothetical protein
MSNDFKIKSSNSFSQYVLSYDMRLNSDYHILIKLLATIDDLEYLKKLKGSEHLKNFKPLQYQNIDQAVEEFGKLNEEEITIKRDEILHQVIKSWKDNEVYKNRMICNAIFFTILEIGEHIKNLNAYTLYRLDGGLCYSSMTKQYLNPVFLVGMRNALLHTSDSVVDDSREQLIDILENILYLKTAIYNIIYGSHNILNKEHSRYKSNTQEDRIVDNTILADVKQWLEFENKEYDKEDIRYIARAITANNKLLNESDKNGKRKYTLKEINSLQKDFIDKLENEYINKLTDKKVIDDDEDDCDWYCY